MIVTGRSIVVVVALVAVMSFGFGWWITSGVRETAARTDTQLRLVAAAVKAFASHHNGDMPTSQQALLADGSSALDAQALNQQAALALALQVIQVSWPPSPNLAPRLEANGLPSGIGTLIKVNEELRSVARGSLQNFKANSLVPAAANTP